MNVNFGANVKLKGFNSLTEKAKTGLERNLQRLGDSQQSLEVSAKPGKFFVDRIDGGKYKGSEFSNAEPTAKKIIKAAKRVLKA